VTSSKRSHRHFLLLPVVFEQTIALLQRQLLQADRQKFVRRFSFELRPSKARQSQFHVLIDLLFREFYWQNFIAEVKLIFDANQRNIVVMSKWFVVSEAGEVKGLK
jgi:hypothetical protein